MTCEQIQIQGTEQEMTTYFPTNKPAHLGNACYCAV